MSSFVSSSVASSDSDIIASQPTLLTRYLQTRQFSESLIQNLSPEDCGLQAMDDTSPPKWHLAHTTWFFETFILKNQLPNYVCFHPQFEYLFNSYYNAIGEQYQRPQRHLLSRPSLEDVLSYRAHVDAAMCTLLEDQSQDISNLTELGINHEQQHQELLLMDIKYSFFQNPLYPAVQSKDIWQFANEVPPLAFESFEGGLFTIGAKGDGFCYDNETPSHDVYLQPFKLANRLLTNREFLTFIEDGGYNNPALWLSDGWAWLQDQPKPLKPMYWVQQENQWFEFTLQGLKPLDPNRPVAHLNYYEADAVARWMDARLPTEQEWEVAASWQTKNMHALGHFSDSQQWHPQGLDQQGLGKPDLDQQSPLHQLYGELWEWTASNYNAYPGYEPAAGAVGEYNGKFMCNQMVLRGGACVTPYGHIRSSYRNFFYPKDRWPFTGVRLAKSV